MSIVFIFVFIFSKKAKCWKSIGFIVFSLNNLSKMNVLRVLDSKNVIKQFKNHVFCSTSCIFSENPCAKMQKKQKSEKNHLFFQRKIFRILKWRTKKSKPLFLRRFWPGVLRSAAGWRPICFTLCVCFCVVPSLNQNENP